MRELWGGAETTEAVVEGLSQHGLGGLQGNLV